MKRSYLRCLCLSMGFLIGPVALLQAGDIQQVDTKIVIHRAHELKDLLNHLLLDTNNSSIQKIIKEGDESIKVLIAEAFKLKSQGEKLLSEKKYMEAAVSLQSALDYVFKAIRTENEQAEPPDVFSARLQEHVKVNDTFITTAIRVVTAEQNPDALELLEMAKAARSRADTESGDGKGDAALLELEHSTRLAQQAIMKVRNGQVIERGQ